MAKKEDDENKENQDPQKVPMPDHEIPPPPSPVRKKVGSGAKSTKEAAELWGGGPKSQSPAPKSDDSADRPPFTQKPPPCSPPQPASSSNISAKKTKQKPPPCPICFTPVEMVNLLLSLCLKKKCFAFRLTNFFHVVRKKVTT